MIYSSNVSNKPKAKQFFYSISLFPDNWWRFLCLWIILNEWEYVNRFEKYTSPVTKTWKGQEYEAAIVRMRWSGSSRHLIVPSAFHTFLVGLSEDLSILVYPPASGSWQYKAAHLSPAESNKPVFSEIYPEDSCPTQNIGDGLRMPSYSPVRFEFKFHPGQVHWNTGMCWCDCCSADWFFLNGIKILLSAYFVLSWFFFSSLPKMNYSTESTVQ